MRNQYGGTCYRCGEWVEPGAGHFERIRANHKLGIRGGWRVQHDYCAIEHRGTDKGKEADVARRKLRNGR